MVSSSRLPWCAFPNLRRLLGLILCSGTWLLWSTASDGNVESGVGGRKSWSDQLWKPFKHERISSVR